MSADPHANADAPVSRTTSGSQRMANPLGVDSERLLIDTAALRRRQLCAAFLHGSARSWRIRRRIWPAAVSGVLIVAIVIAALAVAAAFDRQQEIDDQRQSRSIGWG
ncbi:MAG: hypothetical protein ACR2J5_02400 [Geodermatophilaceae bacterium]